MRRFLCRRVYFHRRQYLLLRLLPPLWGGHPGIHREVITGKPAQVCGYYARETGHLFYGTVSRVRAGDDIASVLPEVFPGFARRQRRGVVYGGGRRI